MRDLWIYKGVAREATEKVIKIQKICKKKKSITKNNKNKTKTSEKQKKKRVSSRPSLILLA